MLKLALLLLTVSGLQAIPIAAPKQRASSAHHQPGGVQRGIQGLDIIKPIPNDFRQGTEPSRRFLVDLNTGLVKDYINEMDRRVVPDDVPALRHGAGWVRVEEPSSLQLPDGVQHGAEPVHKIPDGFRQGTEPFLRIPDGFRQGTEPFLRIPDGFRQGTEPFLKIPDGFRQGTEPVQIPGVYKQGPLAEACKGEFISGKCYEFNPTALAFKDAQASCRGFAPNAELASVASDDLNSRLVSLVTKGGKNNPVLTWLGATVEKHLPSWVDGSEWNYSNWMPGHPNIHADERVCVEMFKRGERWWTATDCELKRASICSYPIAA